MTTSPFVKYLWIPLLCLICGRAQAIETAAYIEIAAAQTYSENATLNSKEHTVTRHRVTAGLRSELGQDFSLSLQGMLFEHDLYESNGSKIDFAFLSKGFFRSNEKFLTLSVGRVKIPYGLYNESRDSVFSRSSYDLPTSVYFDDLAGRNIFFTSDGGRADLTKSFGNVDYALAITIGRDRTLSSDTIDTQFADLSTIADVNLTANRALQFTVSDTFKTIEAKLSYLHVMATAKILAPQQGLSTLPILPDSILSLIPIDLSGGMPPPATRYTLDTDIYVASLRYEPGPVQLIVEAARNHLQGNGINDLYGIGGYLQLGWQTTPDMKLYGRYDRRHLDEADRRGREFANASGRSAHRAFFIRSELGVEIRLSPQWRFYGNIAYNDGTLNILATAAVNASELKRYWYSGTLGFAWQF